jgi:hypothetical protein
MNFPELSETPSEVVAILILFVRAGVEEVDVTSCGLEFPSNDGHESYQLTLLTEQQTFTRPISLGSLLSCFHLFHGYYLENKEGGKIISLSMIYNVYL